MDNYSSFGAPDSEILAQHMSSLYPPQQQQPFQRDNSYPQLTKGATQSQPGSNIMASFPQHQPGPGQAALNGPPGPTMAAPGGPVGMNMPGGAPSLGPGMGGAHPMNASGGPRQMVRQGRMGMQAMNQGGVGMAGMRPGPQRMMGPNLAGQGGMHHLSAPGMPGQGGMPLGAQGNTSGLAGPGGMNGIPNLSGPNGPNGMSMGGGPNGMQIGGGPGLHTLGTQSGMPGLGSQGMPMGPQSGMGTVMSSMGAGGVMPNIGGGMGPQQGGIGGQNGPGNGSNGIGPSNMGSMGLTSLGGPGASGISGANGASGPARQFSYDRYSEDPMKRPGSTPQLDDFGSLSGAGQHGIGVPGGPQHGPQHGQQGLGGPQHGVGGPGIGPQHTIGALQQPPPGQHAGSPVNGLPHHQHHHPIPTHMGQGPPGHMSQSGTPRLNAAPAHAGAPPHMAAAPSPHHIAGSPAHHQSLPHQPHHLVGSPAHQMSSPRHMTSSSPAPGQGPHPPRSGAPTPVPPRGASVDPMMSMLPDGRGRPDGLQQGVTRMNDGRMMHDGQIPPGGDIMAMRDNRMRNGTLPMRAPSTDGIRSEIGRIGPDGTMGRQMPYGHAPPYGVQGNAFVQSQFHQTPAQQHQNMHMRNGSAPNAPRAGSVDEMPMITNGMGIPDDINDMVSTGPNRRTSMPPQMTMINGGGPVGMRPNQGPGPTPGAMRRPAMPSRPCPLGMGIVRLLEMSRAMSNAEQSQSDWAKFHNEFFLPDGVIKMTIFQGVEAWQYVVRPEHITRFFLTFFEDGVSGMSLGLAGAQETSDEGNPFDSRIEAMDGIWRFELGNGWVVEYAGPLTVSMRAVADPAQTLTGDSPQYRLKIQHLMFNAPRSSFLFRHDKLEGLGRMSGQAGPMTPRISPGLAARKTEGGFVEDPTNREEEMLLYENLQLPPKPFQKSGLPEHVWSMLAMAGCVGELNMLMNLSHETQAGPIATLDTFTRMERESRAEVGLQMLPDDLGGHSFPHFAEFGNPPGLPNSSPALTHAHPAVNSQGAIGPTSRPTPPPLMRSINRSGLAGDGDFPPMPGLSAPAPGMPVPSPSLTHPLPPGQQQNGQVGQKRKQGPRDQMPEPGTSRMPARSPVAPRKRAKNATTN